MENKIGRSLQDRCEYDDNENLVTLRLAELDLSFVPPELGLLTNLQHLYLYKNQLTHIPPELGQLTNLQRLHLSYNQLAHIPPELGKLINLEYLWLNDNQLSHISCEIWKLTNLQHLYLENNQLTQIPSELGHLSNSQILYLYDNQLSQIPSAFNQLTSLQDLSLFANDDLLTPPPEIVDRSTSAILAFLRELQNDSIVRYEAKLLVVGEGGTGKSSLLRALRNEEFDPSMSTTHGIEVNQLRLPHPRLVQKEVMLNTRDFGGSTFIMPPTSFFSRSVRSI